MILFSHVYGRLSVYSITYVIDDFQTEYNLAVGHYYLLYCAFTSVAFTVTVQVTPLTGLLHTGPLLTGPLHTGPLLIILQFIY